MNKHIVAIGGGGFGRLPGDLKIEKYIDSWSLKVKNFKEQNKRFPYQLIVYF